MRSFSMSAGSGRAQLGIEAMKALKVVGQAHQFPLEGYFIQTAE